MERLEFELINYDVKDQCVNHNTTETPPPNIIVTPSHT